MGRPLFLLFAFFISLSAGLHAQLMIRGNISNTNGEALPVVSVILKLNGEVISGASSDEKGNFQIHYRFEKGMGYSLELSLTGYHTYIMNFIYPDTVFASHITLTQGKNVLQEVTITTRKPLIQRKTDRYIITIENSFLANGNSGLEVLQKSPGIWVDNAGNIRIKGNEPVRVMINDVIQQLSGEELAEYLKTFKSEDISRIEVISNPSSEFEAGSGGIIHIILKKSKKTGFDGTVNGQYRQQGAKPLISAGNTLNYQGNKIYITGSYTFAKDLKQVIETSNIIYPDKSSYANYTNRFEHAIRNQYRCGIIYDLNSNQSLGIGYSESISNVVYHFNTVSNYETSGQLTSGIANTVKNRSFDYRNTTFNYAWKIDSAGSGLKIIADHTINTRAEQDNFSESYNNPFRDSIYRNNTPVSTVVTSLQADYTRVFKNKMTLKAGTKYSAVKRDNGTYTEEYKNNDWLADTANSNRFIYSENLLMFYTSLERSIGRITIQAGLRAEKTYERGNPVSSNQKFSKEYFGLFPSLFITRVINQDQGDAVYLDYSRRLTRPSLMDLNPYKVAFNSYTSLQGNPDIKPEYTHRIEAGYKFLINYAVDVYVARTTDIISLLAQTGADNIIHYVSVNIDKSVEYGLDLSALFRVSKCWTINNNVSFYHSSYTLAGLLALQSGMYAKSIHTITLKKGFDLEATVEYHSPYRYSDIQNPSSFYCDAGFTKKILRDRVRLHLYFSDIFNTIHEKETTNENNTQIVFYRKRPTRAASISLVYNFSRRGQKTVTKKIETGGNEEKNRIGN